MTRAHKVFITERKIADALSRISPFCMTPNAVNDHMYRPSRIAFWAWLSLAIGAFILSRIPFLLKAPEMIGSDHAVVGLMAHHIAQGLHFPIYYYGQGYMGAGEAYVAGFFFLFFGPSAFAFSLSSLFLFAIFLVLWAVLVREALGKTAALVGVVLMVAMPPRLAEIFMFSLGGYILVLVLGVAFQLSWLWNRQPKTRGRVDLAARWVALVAIVAGGFWTSAVFLFFLLPCVLLSILEILAGWRQAWRSSSRAEKGPRWLEQLANLLCTAGILLAISAIFVRVSAIELDLGCFAGRPVALTPEKAWRHVIRGLLVCGLAGFLALWGRTGWQGLREFLMRALPSIRLLGGVAFGFAIASAVHVLSAYHPTHSFGHVEHPLRTLPLSQITERPAWIWNDFVPYALGGAPGWGSATGRILFCLFLIAWAWMALEGLWQLWRKSGQPAWDQGDAITFSFWLPPLAFLLALVLSSAVQDRLAGRYLAFLVAWWPFALVWLGRRIEAATRTGYVILALFLAITMGGSTINRLANPAAWHASHPQGPFGDVIKRLEQENVRHLYADYWVAYVLTFLSNEKLIATPGAEYTFSQTRYPPYATRVAEAERKAYLFRRDIDEAPRKVVRQAFLSKGQPFNDISVGDWTIIVAEWEGREEDRD